MHRALSSRKADYKRTGRGGSEAHHNGYPSGLRKGQGTGTEKQQFCEPFTDQSKGEHAPSTKEFKLKVKKANTRPNVAQWQGPGVQKLSSTEKKNQKQKGKKSSSSNPPG